MPTTVEEVCNFLIHRPISWLVNVCVGSATGLSCWDVAVEAEGLELVLMDSGQMRAQVPAVSVRSCQPRWRRLHLLEPQGLPQALAQGAPSHWGCQPQGAGMDRASRHAPAAPVVVRNTSGSCVHMLW